MKKRVTIDFDEETYTKFKYFCKKNAFKISTKLEVLMKQEYGETPKEKNYDSMFKFFKQMMDQRLQQPKQMMSGGVIMPEEKKVVAPHPVVKEHPKKVTNGRPIPTLDQLRYRRG